MSGASAVLRTRPGPVSVDEVDEAEVRDAFAAASRFDPVVLVERYIRGSDYRLLVVDGTLVAAARLASLEASLVEDRLALEEAERASRASTPRTRTS